MKKKKLRLKSETVTYLSSGQLEGIHGADTCTASCFCATAGECTMHCGGCGETDLCTVVIKPK